MSTTITVNGARLPVRFVELELARLRLDPENPRLHSAYLTHDLPAEPTQKQLEAALAKMPEFQSLVEGIVRNDGCFTPPLVASDARVLEGNRRVAAVRRLRAEHPKSERWRKITVLQLADKLDPGREKAIRAKYHLESVLAWDGLSQIAEYTALAEREGEDLIAGMLGRQSRDVEALLVAGRCIRAFSALYPDVRSGEALWVIAGLCGVRQVEPSVSFSRATRCLFTERDEHRPPHQPYPTSKIFQWVAEERFTRPYEDESGRRQSVAIAHVPGVFRRVRQAGDEALACFLEENGSLAKAAATLEGEGATIYSKQKRALILTRRFADMLGGMQALRREENADLYRDALNCYHRLGDLLGVSKKERSHVVTNRR